MRRLIFTALLILATIGVAVTYWIANRTMVVERASLGGPPPEAIREENLVGRTVRAFEAEDQNGRPITPQGRVTVVNIWATWCKPCVQEMPRLELEIHQRFQPDVFLVAVAGGQKAETVREFNRRTNLTFALVADPRGEITRRFGGSGPIPRTYVVNRSGVIVHQTVGYSETAFAKLVAAVEREVRSLHP